MDTQNNPDDININIIIPILQMGGSFQRLGISLHTPQLESNGNQDLNAGSLTPYSCPYLLLTPLFIWVECPGRAECPCYLLLN